MKYQSIYQMMREVCSKHPNKIAYQNKHVGEWQNITWQEHETLCKNISKSLIALGIRKDDRINILSQTRLEWIQCDFAIMNCGAVTVGIYPSNPAGECGYVIEHCDAELIFVENDEQLSKILPLRETIPAIKNIVIFENSDQVQENVLNWSKFLQMGQNVSDAEIEERSLNIKPDDLAAIVYTSGTTGQPKGAMITHRNILFSCQSASESLYLQDHFSTLLFLPLAHVFARLVVYFSLKNALTTALAENIDTVADNLKEIRPHFIASVPRIFEKIHTKIITGVHEAGGLKEKLFHWALNVGEEMSQCQKSKTEIRPALKMKHLIAEKLIFSKIHAALGGRLVWAISGAAPLDKNLAEFFHACGILILEGIGMTENASFTNVNRYNHYKFGTVGPVGPGIEMKLEPDGEILYRAPNVMKGYYNDSKSTAEAIDKNGWLHTGDVGEIDEEGFLKITDRKKDIIVTSGGKNVAPQHIEQILRTSQFISQAFVYGDKKHYITALVTLDFEHIEKWASKNGIHFLKSEDLALHPEIHGLIQQEVQIKNRKLASFESIKKIRITPRDFSIDQGELTPTLKIKRKVILKKYQHLLEQMYEE